MRIGGMIAVGDITGDIVHDATDLSVASEAEGDLIARGAANWARLAAGTSGDVLTSTGASTVPTYQTPSAGGADNIEIFLVSGTWTAPAGVTYVMVEVIGAGGGGGGGEDNASFNGGAGGGAGAITFNNVLRVTPGGGHTVICGAGGTPGLRSGDFGAPGGPGGAGGTSSFAGLEETVSATGGTGGGGGSSASGGSGGVGGSSVSFVVNATTTTANRTAESIAGGNGASAVAGLGGASGSTRYTIGRETIGPGRDAQDGVDGIVGTGGSGGSSGDIASGGGEGGAGGVGYVIIKYGSET